MNPITAFVLCGAVGLAAGALTGGPIGAYAGLIVGLMANVLFSAWEHFNG